MHEKINISFSEIEGNWFTEKCPLWKHQRFSFEFESILFHDQSEYQDVLILKTKKFGNVLILDGIIQCSEFDEFTYQEMITFLPLCSHPKPQNVLVVGGGDGGVVREIAKHPLVKCIDLVEIDEMVIEACKVHLASMAVGFESKKVQVKIEDGAKYIKRPDIHGFYDVIITDSSDAIGPNESLFEAEYMKTLVNALNPNGGCVCIQSGNIWFDLELIRKRLQACRSVFATVDFALTNVPTYPNGQIGFILASTSPKITFKNPVFNVEEHDIPLKYYGNDIHKQSFTLPKFAKDLLEV